MRRRVMNTSPVVRMVFWSVFIFVGVIVAVIGLVFLLGSSTNKKRCTEPVTAVVVDNERGESKVREGQIMYTPILEYQIQGQTYRHKSKISTSVPRYQIGQRVELMIDPNDPAAVYEKSGFPDMKGVGGAIILGASAIFLFLGIFGVCLNIKRMKQNQLPPSHSNWN